MKYKFDEFAYLYFLNELNDEEKIEFENIIAEDSLLKDKYEKLTAFYSTVNSTHREKPSDALLSSVRQELKVKINELENKESGLNIFLNKIILLFSSKYSIAYSTAFSLIGGILIGYFIFTDNNSSHHNLPGFNLDDALSENYKIENVHFIEDEISSRNLTIKFDAKKEITINGNISDPQIIKLLASSIINSDNAGLKIRSINKLAEEKNSLLLNDPKIKAALITAVKADPNPGVRKEALSTLKTFNYDSEIRDAFLFVLANDTNSGLRIAAINSLTQMKNNGISLDDKTYNELKDQIENEESEYIKLRTASFLGGIK